MEGTISSPCHANPLEVRGGALFVPEDAGDRLQMAYVEERENSPVPPHTAQNSPADSCPRNAMVLWPHLALWAPAMPHARPLT